MPIPISRTRRSLFCAALLACLPQLAAAQYEDQSVTAFLAADSNGDERLDATEFRRFINGMAAAGAPMSQRIRTFGAYGIAFRRVDTNDDGLATADELRAAEARQ